MHSTSKKAVFVGLVASFVTAGTLAVSGPAQATSAEIVAKKNKCHTASLYLWRHFNKYDTAYESDSPDGYIYHNDLRAAARVGKGKFKKTARYFLSHSKVLDKLDVAADEGGSPDGKISRSDALTFLSIPPAICR
jgi:hypothetical protein